MGTNIPQGFLCRPPRESHCMYKRFWGRNHLPWGAPLPGVPQMSYFGVCPKWCPTVYLPVDTELSYSQSPNSGSPVLKRVFWARKRLERFNGFPVPPSGECSRGNKRPRYPRGIQVSPENGFAPRKCKMSAFFQGCTQGKLLPFVEISSRVGKPVPCCQPREVNRETNWRPQNGSNPGSNLERGFNAL